MNLADLQNLDLNFLKNSLLQQKSEILNKAKEFKHEQITKTQLSDEYEVATQNINDNISIHLHERDRNFLYQIERTLSKISNNTYGICESCEADINSKRLIASPLSTLCIECKEEQEHSKNKTTN